MNSTLSKFLFLFSILFLFVVGLQGKQSPGGKRVLAILEDLSLQSSHSQYFDLLKEQGYSLQFLASDKANANKIHKYGEWFYDHLILFAPHAEEFAGLDAEKVLEFVDQGGNLIVVGDSELSDAVKTIGSECNVEFDHAGSYVIDHQDYNRTEGEKHHTLVASSNYVQDKIVVGEKLSSPVLFKGIGMDIQEESPLLFSVLSGSSFSYSHSPSSAIKSLHVAGKKTSLVAALQARNNARVLFSGSLDLFSNNFFSSPVQTKKRFESSGNKDFAKAVTLWAFQERGALRAMNVTHHLVGQSEAPAMYTVNDNVHFSVEIEEWNGNAWIPFESDNVQLEFIMLDPYLRLPLKHNKKGTYSLDFIAPDIYGVFTFQVQFHQKGYSFINLAKQVPVRPYRHTQFERFIPSAFPYYASAFSMLFGLFVFSWAFLYTADDKPKSS